MEIQGVCEEVPNGLLKMITSLARGAFGEWHTNRKQSSSKAIEFTVESLGSNHCGNCSWSGGCLADSSVSGRSRCIPFADLVGRFYTRATHL